MRKANIVEFQRLNLVRQTNSFGTLRNHVDQLYKLNHIDERQLQTLFLKNFLRIYSYLRFLYFW